VAKDIIKRANDLGAQIKAKRKQAEGEDECHAETKYWGETLDLLDAKIVIEQKVKEICAGFTITGGQTVEDLQARALKVRKWQAAASDGCDPPASAKVPPSSAGGELIGSGTITFFGDGNCGGKNPTVVTQPHDTPAKPAPRTNQPTITGDRFGVKNEKHFRRYVAGRSRLSQASR
jgi:hypothetical protein